MIVATYNFCKRVLFCIAYPLWLWPIFQTVPPAGTPFFVFLLTAGWRYSTPPNFSSGAGLCPRFFFNIRCRGGRFSCCWRCGRQRSTQNTRAHCTPCSLSFCLLNHCFRKQWFSPTCIPLPARMIPGFCYSGLVLAAFGAYFPMAATGTSAGSVQV